MADTDSIFVANHPTRGKVTFSFQEYLDYMADLNYPWSENPKRFKEQKTEMIRSLEENATLRLTLFLVIDKWRNGHR